MKLKKISVSVSTFALTVLSLVDNVWAGATGTTGDAGTAATTGFQLSTGIPQVDTALTVIVSLLLGTVSVMGIITLVKNISDFGQAFQGQDTQGMYMAGKGIAGGLIMTCPGVILGLMGLM